MAMLQNETKNVNPMDRFARYLGFNFFAAEYVDRNFTKVAQVK